MVYFFKINIILLFVLFRLSLQGETLNSPQFYHEAFLIKESDQLIGEATPTPPPPRVREVIPEHFDKLAVWIPGYWTWERGKGMFVWVSGLWRRPPPGLSWTNGEWKKYQEGWVWVSGYWGPEGKNENSLSVGRLPPAPIDEDIPTPPHPQEQYFWIPGNWSYDAPTDQFVWYSGRWELFQSDWIFHGGYYLWRGNHILFVPSFWDWTVNKRGVVFAPLTQAEVEQVKGDVQLKDPLEAGALLENAVPFWPDYMILFQYLNFYQHDDWMNWGGGPPWWEWPTWWCFQPQEAWWLWWWYTHPGYPNPPWLNEKIAQQIPPPQKLTFAIIQGISPPWIVTANGVVTVQVLLKALRGFTGVTLPILPADPKLIIQIQEIAFPTASQPPYPRPSGQAVSNQQKPPLKPFFGPEQKGGKMVTVPPTPAPVSSP